MKKENSPKMKIHSGLLALALLVFAGLACNFSVGNVNSNSGGTANTGAPSNTAPSNVSSSNSSSASDNTSGVHIDELYAAKSADGPATTSFNASDRTVYAIATLSDMKAGTKVKFTWYAADVEGQSKDTKVQDVEYTTGSLENKVSAHLSLQKDWPTGTYRVETEVNGKPDKSTEYTVQ